MAITNATVVPKIIAAQLVIAYRQRRVFAERVNNTWRSALAGGGNEVIINRPLAGSVADYTGTVTYTNKADVNTKGLTLSLGGTGGIGSTGVVKYWQVRFDDLDRALSSIDLLSAAVVEYGEALSNQVDNDIRTAFNASSQSLPAVTIDLDDIAAATDGLDRFNFETMHKAMDWKRVPREGRWLIVGPAFLEALQKSVLSSEALLATPQQASLANGLVGSIAGFTVYMTDPVYSTFASGSGSGTAGKDRYTETVFCGVDSAVAFIDRLRKEERLRLENSFTDAVRGLYEYNAKLMFPEHILKRNYTMAGDTVTDLGLPAAIT